MKKLLIIFCAILFVFLVVDGVISKAPEPVTMFMFGIGLIGAAFIGRKTFGKTK